MDEFVAALRRVAAWVAASVLGGFALLGIASLMLPRVARAATLFVSTPGGLVLVVLAWRTRGRRGNR